VQSLAVNKPLATAYGLTYQVTAAMETYLVAVGTLMNDTSEKLRLWLIIVLILTFVNCAIAHYLINIRLIAGLLHELEETVSLFWTAPLDSMLSVPMIERFLQTGTITSGSEEEILSKSRLGKRAGR